jgi:hypothetical protein
LSILLFIPVPISLKFHVGFSVSTQELAAIYMQMLQLSFISSPQCQDHLWGSPSFL